MNKKVLIVDDSKLWREFLRSIIEGFGCTVKVASDGLEAINKFFEFMPEIVITDYIMPNMNGVHLTRFIRSYPQFKNVGIVILTAENESINPFWAKESGANLFLQKTLDKEKIIEKLKKFCERGYTIEWSMEFYKVKKEPYGELVDLLEERLRNEIIISEVFGLLQYIEDEEYLLNKFFNIVVSFFDPRSIHVLLITLAEGRIYSCSKNNEKFSLDNVKEKLFENLKKPVTPSKWKYVGNFSKDGRSLNNIKSFVLEHNGIEQGVILFENVEKDNDFKKYLNVALEPLGLVSKILNDFSDFKIKVEIDNLTQVFNKQFIISKLNELLKMHRRQNLPLSVVMIDIDDFKKINDTYGHVKGDEVLKQFAKLIKEGLRESDYLGRYGGEEFLVIFPATSCFDAKKVMERILDKVNKYNWKEELGIEKVTFSAGVCCDLSKTVLGLINMADEKLYRAKRNGKNQVVGGE
ncbi:two-component system cell cycle response regulator [Thermosipho japonicus]|uniref:Two-component system cell cycle response regulator n=1 Tax=Thermosipho japonicus TaxID=90323 RepID=A0A841GJF4_9BACT|nr:diguanylate cyclase [Thermosipho japonicus]MBB6062497.1 two-component system cell cycle response regulator [Thermosipho japonicus]